MFQVMTLAVVAAVTVTPFVAQEATVYWSGDPNYHLPCIEAAPFAQADVYLVSYGLPDLDRWSVWTGNAGPALTVLSTEFWQSKAGGPFPWGETSIPLDACSSPLETQWLVHLTVGLFAAPYQDSRLTFWDPVNPPTEPQSVGQYHGCDGSMGDLMPVVDLTPELEFSAVVGPNYVGVHPWADYEFRVGDRQAKVGETVRLPIAICAWEYLPDIGCGIDISTSIREVSFDVSWDRKLAALETVEAPGAGDGLIPVVEHQPFGATVHITNPPGPSKIRDFLFCELVLIAGPSTGDTTFELSRISMGEPAWPRHVTNVPGLLQVGAVRTRAASWSSIKARF